MVCPELTTRCGPEVYQPFVPLAVGDGSMVPDRTSCWRSQVTTPQVRRSHTIAELKVAIGSPYESVETILCLLVVAECYRRHVVQVHATIRLTDIQPAPAQAVPVSSQ